MTDVGFGLFDRRTVLVVLFTMVIAQVLWNLQIPLNTASAGNFFADLVLLTGYLYLGRSVYRLPAALVASLGMTPFLVWPAARRMNKRLSQPADKAHHLFMRKLEHLILKLALYTTIILRALVLIPSLVISFNLWGKAVEKALSEMSNHFRLISAFLGAIDRIGVIVITLVAMIPGTQPVIRTSGVVGLILMLILYIARGDFAALIQDAIQPITNKDRENLDALFDDFEKELGRKVREETEARDASIMTRIRDFKKKRIDDAEQGIRHHRSTAEAIDPGPDRNYSG